MAIRTRKKNGDIFSRFDTVYQSDGRTDGRTSVDGYTGRALTHSVAR